MMVYVIKSGPHQTPVGKCKWLDEPRPGWYDGELKVGACPACRSGQMQVYLTRNSGLDDDDLDISLTGFKTTGTQKGPARDAAAALLGMNGDAAGFVTFVGSYGVGKSHLLKSLVNGFRGIGLMAHYATMSNLLAEIRAKFGDDNGARMVEEVIDEYRRVRVLAIDEVDRVNLTGWAKETIFRLLDSRFNERTSCLTVMATNTEPRQFPAELGYLSSRIMGGVVVEVPGPDMRPAIGLKATCDLAPATPAGRR